MNLIGAFGKLSATRPDLRQRRKIANRETLMAAACLFTDLVDERCFSSRSASTQTPGAVSSGAFDLIQLGGDAVNGSINLNDA